MNLKKAIIAVAGYGTRRLPITKSIEKCMLPIGNRPVVDYLVEDCVANGVTEVIFVVGEQHQQIQQYYSGKNQELESYLYKKNKTGDLQNLQKIVSQATFKFVVQSSKGAYGTAVPLALCAELIDPDEQVLYLAGDDFIYNNTGESALSQLISGVRSSGATSGLLAAEISSQDIAKYGVIELSDGAFVRIVEKPKPENALSNLINISKYVFDKDMASHAAAALNQPASNGECQITDALNMYVADGKRVEVIRAQGEYLDGGSLSGWLHANNVVCG